MKNESRLKMIYRKNQKMPKKRKINLVNNKNGEKLYQNKSRLILNSIIILLILYFGFIVLKLKQKKSQIIFDYSNYNNNQNIFNNITKND